MFFADVVNRGEVPALEKMLAFTEARHRVLTENVANIDTPGYVTKDLDPKAFQHALRQAIDSSQTAVAAPADEASERASGLRIASGEQFHEDADGHLVVTPGTVNDNVLFHDGTNASIERQMAMLAENAMMHQTVTELLRGRFDQMTAAIRGTTR